MYMQKLVKISGMMGFSSFLCMILRVETLGNISKSLCGGACIMVEKNIYKHVESNHGRIHT
jgi:hypothetical protein